MEHTPPPFFKRGPAPVVRLFFFASLSLALLVLDARFRYVEGMRGALALAAYPLQRVAAAPVELAERLAEFFATQSALRAQNAALRAQALLLARDAQRHEALALENAQLRRLIGAAERTERRAQPAEVLYAGRDPYSLKVLLDRGAQHGVAPGSPVIDESGVVGQVTRVHALAAEVTLLTDKDQAIPVQVLRNGLRAVAFGAGASGMLELRYMAANAEIQNGDRLVTSGIDGAYPPGVPVATVVRVERDASAAFARIVCEPAAGVQRGRFVLVLAGEPQRAALPQIAPASAERRGERSRRARRVEADGLR
jgi:rod shape-determining protein MreC